MKHEQGMVQIVVAFALLILAVGLAIIFVASGGLDKLADVGLQLERERTNQAQEARLAEEARIRREEAKWNGAVMLEYAHSSTANSLLAMMMPYTVVGLGIIVGAVLFAQIVWGFPPRTLPHQPRCRHPAYATDEQADAALDAKIRNIYRQQEVEKE